MDNTNRTESSIENSGVAHSNIRASDRSLLAELQKISEICLTKVLKNSLDKADDALFEQSEKAENSTLQSTFFGTMRDIRLKREEIVSAFINSIANSFKDVVSDNSSDASENPESKLELSLMADEDLELSVATDSIVGKCERQFAHMLPALNARFATLTGKARMAGVSDDLTALEQMDANPVSPDKICGFFSDSIDELETEMTVQIVIYKLFERALLKDIDKLYDAINAKLLKSKVLVDFVSSKASQEERQQIIAQEQAAANLADQLADQAMGEESAALNPQQQIAGHSAAAFASMANSTGLSPVQQFFGGNLTSQSLPGLEISANEIQLANEMAQLLAYLPKLGQGLVGSSSAQLIGQTVENMSASATPTIGYDTLLLLLNKLQQEQNNNVEPQSTEQEEGVEENIETKEATPNELLQNLSTELEAASEGDDHSIGYSERDTIGLVSMLFQFIIDDRVVSKMMRRTLGRLQLPIIKVALKDPRFFTNSSHPARVFLNNITSASVSWAESDSYEQDPFYKKIVELVDHIIDEFDDDLAIFDELSAKLDEFIEKDKVRVEKSKQRILDNEIGKDKNHAARSEIESTLIAKFQSDTPDFVQGMLRTVYSDYLLRLSLQKDNDPTAYNDAVSLVDDLLWTISYQRSKDDYLEILNKIPAVVKVLRSSFNSLQISRSQSLSFFKKLASLHKKVMQREEPLVLETVTPLSQALVPQENGAAQVAPEDDAISEQTDSGISEQTNIEAASPAFDTQAYNALENEFSAIDGGQADEEPTQSATATEHVVEPDEDAEYRQKAERLAVGQWVEVHDEQDKLRCRLAAILRASGKRVFVNRRGVKALDMYFDELVERIKTETITMLDDNQLFDKALSSVIGDLREQRRETMAC